VIAALALVEGGVLFTTLWTTTVAMQRAPRNADDVARLLVQASSVTALCLLAFYYNDVYDIRTSPGCARLSWHLVPAAATLFVLVGAAYTMVPALVPSPRVCFTSLVILAGLMLPFRAAVYAWMRTERFMQRLLIVGGGPLCDRLMEAIAARPDLRCRVVGVATDRPVPNLPQHRVLGRLERLARIVAETRPHRIVVALGAGALPMDTLLECRARGIRVEHGLDVLERLTGKIAIERVPAEWALYACEVRKSGCARALARAASLAVAVVGLTLTAPVLALIAIAVRFDSPGPVLFLHDRIGRHGRPFRLLKFRTMRPATGETSQWIRDNEDRVTRVGRWLRRFRLDELPQFVNILRGDMNLVGPRPHPVANYELFRKGIPLYALRTAVRPGVTGWAQVRYGYANDLAEETEKMRYDLYYIRRQSFWFDCHIVLETVKTVLFGRPDAAAESSAALDSLPVQRAS